MSKQFIGPELSFAFKTAGFNNPCFGVYVGNCFYPRYKTVNSKFYPKKIGYRNSYYCTAITFQQATDWILEKYKLFIHLCPYFSSSYPYTVKYTWETLNTIDNTIIDKSTQVSDSPQEALRDALCCTIKATTSFNML